MSKNNNLNFFEKLAILDSLISKGPVLESVGKLKNLLSEKSLYKYFFEKINDPSWIKLLKNMGYFSNPPKILKDNKGYITFPEWPESQYLARVAPKAPNLVCETILEIPETDNVRIHEDFIDAALNMPPVYSAKIAERESEWIKTQHHLYLLFPEKTVNLIIYLTKGGQLKRAFDLIQSLLSISPGPRIKMEIWGYKEILDKCTPLLLRKVKLDLFRFFSFLLKESIKFSIREKKRQQNVDLSFVWRVKVENDSQKIKDDLRNILVNAVRDAAELLIKENMVSLEKIIDHLESYPYPIFRRIIFYLLWRFTEQAQELIPKYLTDYHFFSDPHFRHEYTLLLQKAFRFLSPEEKEKIFKWIEDGPEPELLKRKSPEEKEHYKKWWLYRELARFNLKDLPEKWQKQYKELVKEFGEPEHPDLEVYFSTWSGPTSPLTVEELRQKSIDEIINFLKEWEPPEDIIGEPSPEGLGRALSTAVTQKPEKFARYAEQFIEVNPTYVRHLILGLTEALKQGKTFLWEPILNLCQLVVNQPRDISAKKKKIPFGLDPDWGWTRKEIASLLETSFEKNAFPFELREQIWKILELLTEDPDPTPEDERKKAGPPELEWPTLAINSIRGKAIHAVIRYALWVRNHLEERQKYHGFDSMLEVKAVLEKHLNPSYDPSLAIRSVYGQWFPWLVYLDRKWAKEKVSQIFPIENSNLRDAAWETYLTFNKAYKEVFDILREQYAYSVDQLEYRSEDQPIKEYEKNLAAHLMTFYGLGLINLDDSIFDKFWENGGLLRKEALEFVGRAFYYTDKSKISERTIVRFKQLWDKLWEKFKEAPDQYKQEISTFGWWFIAEKFENDWTLTYLPKVLKVAGAEIERFVIKEIIDKFTSLVEKKPQEVLLCLKYIFETDQEGWNIYFSRENIKTILNKALSSSNVETVKEAKRLINYLGSRGYFEFRELLKI